MKTEDEARGPHVSALLVADDVAALLQISTGAVYKMVERGQIPHTKIGRRLRFHPSAIESWVAEKGRTSSTK